MNFIVGLRVIIRLRRRPRLMLCRNVAFCETFAKPDNGPTGIRSTVARARIVHEGDRFPLLINLQHNIIYCPDKLLTVASVSSCEARL